MNPVQQKHLAKIKRILAVAYHEKDKNIVEQLEPKKVMARIQDLGSIRQAGFLESFQQVVWRLAPVACALIFILGLAVFEMDVLPDYELTNILLDDPSSVFLSSD